MKKDLSRTMHFRLLPILWLIVCCVLGTNAGKAAEIKVSTWNLNWLTLRPEGDPSLPADVHARRAEDFALLHDYAIKLAADIIGFQEVDGAAAVARVFDPAVYDIVTIDEDVVQRVGLAVRHGIRIVAHSDYAPLDVEPYAKFRLRDGLDATLALPGGTALRVLVVHLKTGCHYDTIAHSHRTQCRLFAQQIPPLAAWAAARQAEGTPFLILGDFNRIFDDPEELGTALAAAAPMRRATEHASSPCWDGGEFIDHIFAGGPATNWIEPGSLRVQVFHEAGEVWKQRLSDHCPVSVKLQMP